LNLIYNDKTFILNIYYTFKSYFQIQRDITATEHERKSLKAVIDKVWFMINRNLKASTVTSRLIRPYISFKLRPWEV